MYPYEKRLGVKLYRVILLAAILLAPVAPVQAKPMQQASLGEGGEPGHPAVTNSIFMPLVSKPLAPPAPSSQEKIYKLYAAGDINYETYLLYRVYALFGDSILPSALQGRIAEDPTLFFEIANPQQPLSAGALAKLQPYLVRPDHPDSAANGLEPLPEGANPGLNAPVELPAEFACADPDGDEVYWATLDSTVHPFRVHRTCFNSPALDENIILPSLQKVAADLDALWGPMTEHMGAEPLKDAGDAGAGGDDRLDIYIVPTTDKIKRDYEWVGFQSSDVRAFVRSTDAKQPVAKKSAGFMVIDLNEVLNGNPARLKATIAHEFFHLLQYAHNYDILHNAQGESLWFTEASATWASWHFVPEARQLVHAERFPGFQDDDLPLNVQGPVGTDAHDHNYTAYIWPFFMEQQAGPQAIAAAWDGIEGANTWKAANSAIDAQVSFSNDFNLFALRNLVDREDFSGAISKRYMEFDPQFPRGLWPRLRESRTLVPMLEPELVAVDLPHLTADYYYYEIDPETEQIEVNFEGVAPAESFRVDALLYLADQGWVVRHWSGINQVKLCLDQEPVRRMYLSASNTDFVNEKPVTGNMSIHSRFYGCSCEDMQAQLENIQAFRGTFNFSFSGSYTQGKEWMSISQQAQVQTMIASREAGLSYMDEAPQGTGQFSYIHAGPGFVYSQGNANGSLMPYGDEHIYSRVALYFDNQACTYVLHATLYVMGQWNDFPPDGVWIGSFSTRKTRMDTETMLMSGGEAFPIYSEEYNFKNEPPLFFGDTVDVTEWAGEGTQFAEVSWSLEPVYR